jgi:hypothetical protein
MREGTFCGISKAQRSASQGFHCTAAGDDICIGDTQEPSLPPSAFTLFTLNPLNHASKKRLGWKVVLISYTETEHIPTKPSSLLWCH